MIAPYSSLRSIKYSLKYGVTLGSSKFLPARAYTQKHMTTPNSFLGVWAYQGVPSSPTHMK